MITIPQEAATPRVAARPSAAPLAGCARLAFAFVRGQLDVLAGLLRIVRGEHRHWLTGREEERW